MSTFFWSAIYKHTSYLIYKQFFFSPPSVQQIRIIFWKVTAGRPGSNLVTFWHVGTSVRIQVNGFFSRWNKNKKTNKWKKIKSLVHKIWLHGRRGKGMADSFSREKLRHAPQKEGGWEILFDLPPVWRRLARPTNLMSRINGKKTHTHTHTLGRINASGIEWLGWQGRIARLCAI